MQELIKYDTPRGELVLSHQIIRELCPKATDAEIGLFLKVCLYHHLNPFLREVYLVKYDERAPASIIIGKETFTQRAEAHPAFDGFRAGVLLERDGNLLEVAGSFVGARDTLVGGWAEVFRKDRQYPFRISVSLSEFNRKQSTWSLMPATMIRKVALVQALREAFPSLYAGLHEGALTDTTGVEDGVELQLTRGTPQPRGDQVPDKEVARDSPMPVAAAIPVSPPSQPERGAIRDSDGFWAAMEKANILPVGGSRAFAFDLIERATDYPNLGAARAAGLSYDAVLAACIAKHGQTIFPGEEP